MRTFFGILLIIIGWFIALIGFLAGISSTVKEVKRDPEIIRLISYSIGTLIGVSIFVLLAYWLVKTGLKLTKKKKVNDFQDKIESIK